MKACIISALCLFSFGAQAKDYLNYHTYINNAEKSLVNDRVDSCFYYYDKAFNEFDFIFVKDATIAAEVALRHHDYSRLLWYLIRGAQNGLQTECLNLGVFDDLKNLPAYVTIHNSMDTAIEHYRARHAANAELAKDWQLRFGAMMDIEQLGSSDEKETAIKDNVKTVKDLLATKGYPGEKLLGPMQDCEEMANYTAIRSLLLYDCWMGENHAALWECVKLGELHPREFATMCEAELSNEKNKNFHAVYNKSCYVKIKPWGLYFALYDYRFVSPQQYATIDALREKYGLCDIETDMKKLQLEQAGTYKFTFGKWHPPLNFH